MRTASLPVACTIAGSDSSGGAGIQADLKTFSSLGVWGCAVVTAVTSQTSTGVTGIWNVPAAAVESQIDAVLSEFPVAAMKTGMLATEENVLAVAGRMSRRIPLIIDPVLASTGGIRLLRDDAGEAFLQELVPRAILITPNRSEAAHLSGLSPIQTEADIHTAASRILDLGPEFVLIKGGHFPGAGCIDTLFWQEGMMQFGGERYPYDPHGTGCSLSAAITAFLAAGDCDVREAVGRAEEFTRVAIREAIKTGYGYLVNPGARKDP